MGDRVLSPTGSATTISQATERAITLFTARAVLSGVVQAGNIAAPGVATDRDAGGPLANLTPSRIPFEGINPAGFHVEAEITAPAAITTISCTVLYYTSEDGVTWHFFTSSGIIDTTALISGNPQDTGFHAAAGTTFRAFGPLAGFTPPAGTKFIAVAIRGNTAAVTFTVSLRVVLRPT